MKDGVNVLHVCCVQEKKMKKEKGLVNCIVCTCLILCSPCLPNCLFICQSPLLLVEKKKEVTYSNMFTFLSALQGVV